MASGRSAGSDRLSSVNTGAGSDVAGAVPGLILSIESESVKLPLTKRQRKRKRDNNRKSNHVFKAIKLQEAIEKRDNEMKGIEEELMTMKACKGECIPECLIPECLIPKCLIPKCLIPKCLTYIPKCLK